MNEFDLIAHYFRRSHNASGVVLDNGDDCAIVKLAADESLVFSLDTMVEGVHFLSDIDPVNLGYRALATAVSDLAAMGASPRWFTLALTLPSLDHDWLAGFSSGLFELADYYQMALLGGDTTRGPLTISIQVHGVVKAGCYLSRANAEVGDIIAVTGTLGDAAAGLSVALNKLHCDNPSRDYLLSRFERPTPRIEQGQVIAQFSRCGIDVSDGLLADVGHIAKASGVCAVIDASLLPVSKALSSVGKGAQLADYPLRGGDDYELCFTVHPEQWPLLQRQFEDNAWALTAIGEIHSGEGVHLLGQDTAVSAVSGFKHF